MLCDDIRYLTERALWETENLMKCIPDDYFYRIQDKIQNYIVTLKDADLSKEPEDCDMSRFRLILGQFRHWHRHMGIIYGFIIEDIGKWPHVLNMNREYPAEDMPNYF